MNLVKPKHPAKVRKLAIDWPPEIGFQPLLEDLLDVSCESRIREHRRQCIIRVEPTNNTADWLHSGTNFTRWCRSGKVLERHAGSIS